MHYKLEQRLLSNYAKVMVHFAINNGNGIKKGDTVYLVGAECTKDLYLEICKEIWKAGGNVIMRYLPDEVERYGMNRTLLEIGTDEQLSFFSQPYWQGVTDAMDHLLFIIADPNIHHLEGIPAEKISLMERAKGGFMQMRSIKEDAGKFSWTLCMYGTQSMADEAGISIDEYWEEIIQACYLRDDDPVASWRHTRSKIFEIKEWLNSLDIQNLYIQGKDVDLVISLGESRKWVGLTGHNIPSYEIYTSPDWRGTTGTISFNQPLYYNGKKIAGVHLEFEQGVVIKASATENQEALLQMIATDKNANKVGEFSLTDKRYSRISRFMAETLFDENIGGAYGNTHIALGDSYREAYTGDIASMTEDGWAQLGFNKCRAVHTDIISTTDRKVTAVCRNGEELVIYQDGQFAI